MPGALRLIFPDRPRPVKLANDTSMGYPALSTLSSGPQSVVREPVSPKPTRRWTILSGLLLVALVGLVFATFSDYGMTLDEGVQNRYGRRLVRWYASLGSDTRATEQNDLYFYGGFFELAVQAVQPLSGLGVYDNRHLVNALFGLVGIVAAWGMGAHVGGPMAGFLSALFLTLTPAYYGHSFANPKDIPFAALFALAAWAILRASERVSGLGWRDVVATGGAIGLAAGVRVAGIVLFGFAAALWLGCAWLERREPNRPPGRDRPRGLPRLSLAWLGTVAVGWAVMVAFWPWAQLDPLRNPLRALSRFSTFTDRMDLLFDGRMMTSGTIPRSYAVTWFALTLPEFYFIALPLGLVALLALLRRRLREPGSRRRLLQAAWVAALATAPLVWVTVRRTPLYNGHRHLLFVLPFLAVLAALCVTAWHEIRPRPVFRVVGVVALAGSLLLTAVDMVRLHPYQYVFFNRLVAGGLPRAVDRYDADYWIAASKEAIEWLPAHYDSGGRRVRVAGPLLTHTPFMYYLERMKGGRRFNPVTVYERPHLVLASTAYRLHERIQGRVVHVVERLGAPLLYVYEVRPPG
jgi:hypothetical protein